MTLLLLLVIGYGAVWAVVAFCRTPYRNVLAQGVEQQYRFRGSPIELYTVGETIAFRSMQRPSFEATLDTQGVDSNLAFLVTLILITPGMRLSRRVSRLAGGVGLLLLTHVLFVTTKVETALRVAGHPLGGESGLWEIADNFFEISGKSLFPILIWLGLCLPYLMGHCDQRDRPAGVPKSAVGRNQRCPCGSGRKFKHCCGP